MLLSWSIPPAASFALLLTAILYLRGWLLLWRGRVPYVPPWRAVSFLLGLLSLWVALASPFDTFSGFVLTAHMLQHMMLMMVAPPLILLGAPLIPLVRGLPAFAAREFAGPFLNWRVAIRVGNFLTEPLVALVLMGVVMFAWHTPRLYELALASGSWHECEHACFFLASLVFWWPVVQPWPSRARWPRWAVVPYLLIGDLQNTVLSAILIFSDRVIYPSYATVPRLFGLSALQDQTAAGSVMWVVGSVAFLIPATIIAVQCLQKKPHIGAAALGKREPSPLDSFLTWAERLSFKNFSGFARLRGRRGELITFLLLFAACGLFLAHRVRPRTTMTIRPCGWLSNRARSPSRFSLCREIWKRPTGFNVLVQDAATREVLQDASVTLSARSSNTANQAAPVKASAEDSENKLLQSAQLSLPAEGDWAVNINVARASEAAAFILPVRVVKPDGGISWPWAYLVLLMFSAILLFAYFWRHRAPRMARIEQPVSTLRGS